VIALSVDVIFCTFSVSNSWIAACTSVAAIFPAGVKSTKLASIQVHIVQLVQSHIYFCHSQGCNAVV